MKRASLISLVFLIFLRVQGLGQGDSLQHLASTDQRTADSGNTRASDYRDMPATPALKASPTGVAQTGQEPVNDVAGTQQAGYSVYWLIGCGLLGIILGGLGFMLLNNRSGKGKEVGEEAQKNGPYHGDQVGDGGFVAEWNLEQERDKLCELNNALTSENDQLRRDKEKLEQQLKTANDALGMAATNLAKEIVFYMPQPNMNGRFQEASKRTDAVDALYAFHVAGDNQSHASFEFIAQDAYLNAAIGNEPSWISIACDRTNQPSGTTTRVKTESRGQASLKDGEWEITRKAKITYL